MDPSTRPQKPIPFRLIKDMITRPCSDPGLRTFHELANLAVFFAMRSCKYLETKGSERRTDAIRLRNLIFRKDNRIVPHSDPNLPNADTITVVFEFQKRDLRDDAITQSKTSDPLMCPVKAAAAIVRRIRQFTPDNDTHVYAYQDSRGKLMRLNSQTALVHLRNFIKTIDKGWGLD
ncbi:hypothetical protein, partial [Janthinobacterium sp.]|uniref:hypothetical protein n=1 Tax=Janthinobacterium sp. TaxID=1871054 RepID=UPI00293D92B8